MIKIPNKYIQGVEPKAAEMEFGKFTPLQLEILNAHNDKITLTFNVAAQIRPKKANAEPLPQKSK